MLLGSDSAAVSAAVVRRQGRLAISVTVFGLNLIGDAIRDVTDPRLRGGLG